MGDNPIPLPPYIGVLLPTAPGNPPTADDLIHSRVYRDNVRIRAGTSLTTSCQISPVLTLFVERGRADAEDFRRADFYALAISARVHQVEGGK
jgi:hypothetical protein